MHKYMLEDQEDCAHYALLVLQFSLSPPDPYHPFSPLALAAFEAIPIVV
jgi:hypothetical protein